jgi:CRP-like cAMP-binding protein
LNGKRNLPDTDLDKLKRLTGLLWLAPSELISLARALAVSSFVRHEVILCETAMASEAHILLGGIGRITCVDAHRERVTVAMVAPGPIPEFPTLPASRFDFRCEAYTDCRVGSVSWGDFNDLTAHGSKLAFKRFHQNDLQHWYRVLLRGSSLMALDLHERIGITLLDLASDFGIKESRGMLLRAAFSHQDIADLVGASRPRVTEHLAQFETEHMIIRQGRQLIVCADKLALSNN